MDSISIETRDLTGVWRVYSQVVNNSQRILQEMKNVQSMRPNWQVRAVDKNGRVVDFLSSLV